ncbi:hypothetical protein D3C74_437500 [compost metagenome]
MRSHLQVIAQLWPVVFQGLGVIPHTSRSGYLGDRPIMLLSQKLRNGPAEIPKERVAALRTANHDSADCGQPR